MRLIDAEKVKVEEIIDEDGHLYSTFEINEEPTVKAVTVEALMDFIGKRALQPNGTFKYSDDMIALRSFIDDWRMDNETGYRDAYNRWWAEHSSRFD